VSEGALSKPYKQAQPARIYQKIRMLHVVLQENEGNQNVEL